MLQNAQHDAYGVNDYIRVRRISRCILDLLDVLASVQRKRLWQTIMNASNNTSTLRAA
jgi:hypothetical protein